MIDAMCIGAHPDDVEIGMGATVAKMVREGWDIAIVDLTNGEPTPHGTPELRARESARAAEALGAQRRTLSQPNRYLFDSVEARKELAECIRELRPRILFLPYSTDAHPDHIAASSIATAARFYAKFTKTDMAGEPFYPARVYRYMAVHLSLVVEPSFIVAVEPEDVQRKVHALEAYESQFGVNPANSQIVPMMQQLAAVWGSRIGASAGEPFYALEPVGVSSVSALV